MLSDEPAAAVCIAGFYIDYPDPNHPGQRLLGFITAAQCAERGMHTPVFVMKDEAGGQRPSRIKVGEITHVAPGDPVPAIAGEPWTMPSLSLAVFSSGRAGWAFPVGVMINEQVPPTGIVQNPELAQQSNAPAKWRSDFGNVVTGHVLDPASTPELRDIPAGVARVVVAADDAASPIDQWVCGSPVTVDLDGVTENLGVITAVDETRHWVVVDLMNPVIADQHARLVTTR